MIFRKFLEKKNIVWIRGGAGLQWKLDLRNSTHRWIVYGLYDPPFLKWAKGFLPKNGIVVDSGANIGQTVMYLGQYVTRGKLFAFEPGEKQANWLEECVERNRAMLKSTEIHRWALGDEKGCLYLKDTWVGERFHGASSEISDQEGEAIEVIRLSDFLKERRIPYVDLWKLDVEGYEIPALQGAEEFLKEKRIRALYVELYRQSGKIFHDHGRKVRQYLSNYGYRCHFFDTWGRLISEKNLSDISNGVFLPS